MIDEHRCLSSCEVLPGSIKRCVRAVEHSESHLWVEALNRSHGVPMLAMWDHADGATSAVIADVVVRRKSIVIDEDLTEGLITIVGLGRRLLEACDGYRSECLAHEYPSVVVDAMVVDFHKALIAMTMRVPGTAEAS